MIGAAEAAFRAKLAVAGRTSVAMHHDFLRADALSPEQIEAVSLRRAADHARFAMEHSPFYRDYYRDHGFRPTDLADPEAFSSLPLVDKAMLREHGPAIATDEADERTAATSKTGGSTGLPLHIQRDLRFPARALEWRLFSWWGVQPWDDRAILTRHMHQGADRVRHRLSWWPSRHIQLDAFRLDDDAVLTFARQWQRVRPRFLIGYGGGVLELARRLDRLGISLEPPQAIAVTAAPLTPGTRAEIEAALGAPVHDHYRSAEVPWLAGECAEHDGLHIFADVRRVEILGADDAPVPDGTEGSVVASDLTNRVFPVIRYRIGDISSRLRGTCACGRGLPRLGAISGRSSDAVRLPDGTAIAGALGHIFDDAPLSVRQFEIVQAEDGAVTLRCIPGADVETAAAGIAGAERRLATALRGLVPLAVEMVDEIPQVGGKMRFIRSAYPVVSA
ncbi:phenylacetate--CoA ligase family protein [Agrococcus sp. Marseille-P2731]|uniref:phenylacetate--CoA ligase family protein n=1 Tax=Agrococcus sp. Marseille-P2731 TaxID=1841862 RepID=UPI000A5FCDFA|nr:hypothetical protein [Agrococcus sp. Marseille-P2731]